MRLDYWASCKVNGTTGTFIGGSTDQVVSVAKISTGVYELTLLNSLGVAECCPLVTPWYAPPAVPPIVKANAGLKADGSVLVVNITDDAGAPADANFCCVIQRFSPSS
jgi:hypothetical protein